MRRLHRNAQVRLRLEALEAAGVTEEQIDTNQDGVISDEELDAAEAALKAAIALVEGSGLVVTVPNPA